MRERDRAPVYNIVTWNVRGLGTKRKQRRVLAYLQRQNTHIAFLQETHMTKERLDSLGRSWRGRLIGTVTSSFARGVLIWVSSNTPYIATSHTVNPDGRYVVIEGSLDGTPLALVAIYAPNFGQNIFLDKITPALLQDPHVPIIWGGDFNSVLDIDMDRSHPPVPGQCASALLNL